MVRKSKHDTEGRQNKHHGLTHTEEGGRRGGGGEEEERKGLGRGSPTTEAMIDTANNCETKLKKRNRNEARPNVPRETVTLKGRRRKGYNGLKERGSGREKRRGARSRLPS